MLDTGRRPNYLSFYQLASSGQHLLWRGWSTFALTKLDVFIDVDNTREKMDEEEAKRLFVEMAELKNEEDSESISEGLLRDFRDKTNLSIRQIAGITGLNKDKVNRMLRR